MKRLSKHYWLMWILIATISSEQQKRRLTVWNKRSINKVLVIREVFLCVHYMSIDLSASKLSPANLKISEARDIIKDGKYDRKIVNALQSLNAYFKTTFLFLLFVLFQTWHEN